MTFFFLYNPEKVLVSNFLKKDFKLNFSRFYRVVESIDLFLRPRPSTLFTLQ